MAGVTKIEWRPHPRYRANLETLTTLEWAVEIGIYSTARVALMIIERNPVVKELRAKYQAGLLTDEQLEAFVDKTAEAFKTNYHFEYTDAWLAVLWIVRDSPGKFPDELVSFLADKRYAELSIVCRAATIILKERLSSGVQKEVRLPPSSESPSEP